MEYENAYAYPAVSETEQRLAETIEGIVADLPLPELLALQPERDIPKSIGQYSLTLVKAKSPLIKVSAGCPGFNNMITTPGVRVRYDEVDGTPFLENKFAIGLVYRDTLAAVGGARLGNNENGFFVTQLQAVNTAPGLKHRFATGLFAGFYWPDTLINTWSAAGEQLDLPNMTVQGASNNTWARGAHLMRLKRFIETYDHAAQRLGYIEDEDRNWTRPNR
jgi:hypothetical protein